MNKIILSGVFCILFVALLANPAPLSLEIEDVILLILPFLLCLFCLSVSQPIVIAKTQYQLCAAILFYCLYLILSILVGLLHDVPFLNILRGIGPYINFIPLLSIGFMPPHRLNPWRIAFIFMMIGSFQACFQLYLYFSHSVHLVNTQDVLRGRITLFNPRTTLPLVLAAAILPFAFFSQTQKISLGVIALGLFGAAVTLTRSIVLSIFFGWFLFLILFLYQKRRLNQAIFSALNRRHFFYISLFLLVMLCISFLPKFQILEQGLFARFSSSSASLSADYDDGRIYNEWLPALASWIDSDWISLLFGIGAGNTFTVATGEERTYIHNMLLYGLVYGGFVGFLASLGLYLIAFKTLIHRALQSEQVIYLAFAALLGSLFFYAQFFAVHKGLAFNAMLFLILSIALYQPEGSLK